MNHTEEAFYNRHIKPNLENGNLLFAHYEQLKFILGPGSTWLPDFVLVTKDGDILVVEIKGFWKADDRIQVKVVAGKFPYLHVFGARCTTKKIVKAEGFGGAEVKQFPWLFGESA